MHVVPCTQPGPPRKRVWYTLYSTCYGISRATGRLDWSLDSACVDHYKKSTNMSSLLIWQYLITLCNGTRPFLSSRQKKRVRRERAWVATRLSTRSMSEPTQYWQLSQRLLLHNDLPERIFTMAINNRPEKHPIKMSDMIHDDYTTLLEMTFEPKYTNLYAKHFFCMCVYVCVR